MRKGLELTLNEIYPTYNWRKLEARFLMTTRPGDKNSNITCLYWNEDNMGTEKPLEETVVL